MPAITEQKIPVWGERIQLKIQVAGSGPPVVYFHPAGGLFWDSFLESLTHHYTVYAPEHPGTSAGDPQAIDQVDDLWDLVLIYGEMYEKLELQGAATVGQSFGGMMACEISACYPDYVSKQVLLAPA
ncbi:MAG: alpha/beta fold hydrolase, partial [Dehalococcoidia bacterium]